MAITGINNSSYTSYYASGYKNTVKKAACDIQKTKENSQVSKTEESQEDYVKKLQEKNPQIDIVAGSSDKNVKTANQTVMPKGFFYICRSWLWENSFCLFSCE